MNLIAGTDVFWTSIDIFGKKCIIMIKLPFPAPDEEDDENSGFILGYQEMLKKFKQGIGRMLRSEECQGEIIILDNRIVKYKEVVEYLNELEKKGARIVYEFPKIEKPKLHIVKS